jgi:integrase/recombinase XerD
MDEGIGAGDLRIAELERFLRARRVAGYRQLLSIKAMRPILTWLCDLGEVPKQPSSRLRSPVKEALERYRNYLTAERGLGHATARAYLDAVRPFLRSRALHNGLILDFKNR